MTLPARRVPLLIGLVALAVYVWITPPVSGLGDGPEFTVGLATCGLVHPTGYPVYIMVGHLFVRAAHSLGVGWALAANAWSGVGGAVAVALFFATAYHIASERHPDGSGAHADSERGPFRSPLLPVLAATTLLALNPVLLDQAAEAEVNAWALAWTMGLALHFTIWIRRIERGEERSSLRDGAIWGILCGLGLAHHLTSVLVAGPLTVGICLALARQRHLRPGLAGVALAGASAPLLAYALVAWRAAHPAPGQWAGIEPTLRSVLDHVTGQRYRMFFGYFAPDDVSRRLLASGVYPFLLPGLVLLGIAGAQAPPLRRIVHWSFLAAAILTLLFTLNYGVPDPAPYLLPATGVALLGLAPLAAAFAGGRGVWRGAFLAGAALLLAALAWTGLGAARARREEAIRFDRSVRSLWAQVPDTGALLFWNVDQVTRLIEYQTLRHERQSVWVASPQWLLDPAVRALVRRRFGADPIDGMEIPYAPLSAPWSGAVRRDFFLAVVSRLGDRTGLPVYWLDSTVPRLIVLRAGRRVGHGEHEREATPAPPPIRGPSPRP